MRRRMLHWRLCSFTTGEAFAALQHRQSAMLRSLRPQTPCTAPGYVCRSCRHRLQSARRLQSTGVAAAEEGGEDDGYAHCQGLSGKNDREGRAGKEHIVKQQEPAGARAAPAPRGFTDLRRLPADHPAVNSGQMQQTPSNTLQRRLELDRRQLAAVEQGKPTSATARTTALTRRRSNEGGVLSSLRSRIALHERVLELRENGVLVAPDKPGRSVSAGSKRATDAGAPRRLARSARGSLKKPRRSWTGLPVPTGYQSTDEMTIELGALQERLRAKVLQTTDGQSNPGAAVVPATIRETAFSRLAADSPSVRKIRRRILLFERVLEKRRSGELPEPRAAPSSHCPLPPALRFAREKEHAESDERKALWREFEAAWLALREEFGREYSLKRTTHPSYVKRETAFLRKLLHSERKKRSPHQSPEQPPGAGDTRNDDHAQPPSRLSSSSGIPGLDSVIFGLQQEFRTRVEYASNVSGRDAVEEPTHAGGDRETLSRNDKTAKAARTSDIDDLRRRLAEDNQATHGPNLNSAATHEHKSEQLQSMAETMATSNELPSRLSMPRFAASSDPISSFSSTNAGPQPTIAQKVREVRDRPKWGGLLSSADDVASESPGSRMGKPQMRLRKLRDEGTPQAQGKPTEEVAASFADSPADLAELHAARVAQPVSSKQETAQQRHPGASKTTKDSKASKERDAPKMSKPKEGTLKDLKRDLNAANHSNERNMRVKAVERSEDNDRAKAVERNVQDYPPTSAPAPSINEAIMDQDASASLANLHRSSNSTAKDMDVAPSAKEKPEAAKEKADRSKTPKPAKTGGRRGRRARELKKASAVTTIAKDSDVAGGDGDNGEHKPLWEVMQSLAPASAPEEQVTKPLEADTLPLEPSDDGPLSIASVKAADLHIDALKIPQPPVPGLEYGLDRVLFNPGVYQLQDPTSRVYNFDPYLQDIMPAVEFDFNALKEYKTSSEDKALSAIAEEYGKRYIGSTSSMTSTLAHFHYLLSNWRTLNLDMLSRGFNDRADEFTRINRAPNAIFLRWKPESKTYAIDADKEFDGANVLMMLGKSMEKMLTLPTSEFEKYRKNDPREVWQEAREEPEAFEYTTMGDFLMRSQLDAHDPRLPGTGMFDLKTRAVLSIRMDAEDFEPMLGYEIHTLQGRWNSYEREYYDMMRSTMLKYMLQARMGRMQGIFAAYHNIERIFGFQYIPMRDMDRAIHGQIDPCLGDQEFKLSLELLNKVLDKATAKFPEKSLRFHFETSQQNLGGDTATSVMSIFAEPMEEQEIDRIQSLSKEKVREFERNVMGVEDRHDVPAPKGAAAEGNASGDQEPIEYPPVTPELPSKEAENPEPDREENTPPTTYPPATPEPGSREAAASTTQSEGGAPTEYPPATPEPLREESEINEPELEEDPVPTTYPPATPEPSSVSSNNPDFNSSSSAADPDFLSSLTGSSSGATSGSSAAQSSISRSSSHLAPLFAATLMAKSRVNGDHVTRPSHIKPDDDWAVEYLLTEYPETDVTWARYAATKAKRKEVFSKERDEDEDVAPGANGEAGEKKEKKRDHYIQFLQENARRGREFRKEMDAAEEGREKKFVWKEPGTAGRTAATSGPGMTVTAEVADVGDYMEWLYAERGRKM